MNSVEDDKSAYYTYDEFAKRIKSSRDFVVKLVDTKVIRRHKFGDLVRIKKVDAHAYEDRCVSK